MITVDDQEVATIEARRARHLAEAAVLSDEIARLDGTAATTAGREWVRRKLAAEIGCATRRSERAVTRLVDESERLVEQLPHTLAALERGSISYAHARSMIAHAITLPEGSRADFEQQALPDAQVLPAYRFDDRARRLREHVHPESIVTRTKNAQDARHVLFTPECDGMATILHHLPAVDALAIDGLTDKIARAERSDGDGRTHAQRRCDALSDLILGRRDRPRISPTVLVTVPARTIAGDDSEPGELHGYGPIDPVTARSIAATAPTFLRALLSRDSGAPLVITRHRHRPLAGLPSTPRRHPPADEAAAGCDVRHDPHTQREFDPDDLDRPHDHLDQSHANALYPDHPHALYPDDPHDFGRERNEHEHEHDDLGRTHEHQEKRERVHPDEHGRMPMAGARYSASPIVRTALALLDETCRFPGCGRRANRCELDHTRAWSEGGATTPDNLAHLCSRHHHLKHEGGWKVSPSRDGTRSLTWTSPRGVRYTSVPPCVFPSAQSPGDIHPTQPPGDIDPAPPPEPPAMG
jgi:hypothetical protein